MFKIIVLIFQTKTFGDAGNTIVVEELLEGEEVSVSVSVKECHELHQLEQRENQYMTLHFYFCYLLL